MKKDVKKEVVKETSNVNYGDKLLDFWSKDIKKKFIIILIISVVLVILFTNFMYAIIKADMALNNPSSDNVIIHKGFVEILKNKMATLGLTLLAGVVPYFYIPVVGLIGYIFTTGSEISMKLLGYGGINFSILSPISIILDIISISLVASIGVYFTVVSTKKFMYSGTKRFTFLDLKLQTYEIMNKTDKIEKTKKQIEKRNMKQEKNNIKVKYLELLGMFGIATVIQTIAVLIDVLTK